MKERKKNEKSINSRENRKKKKNTEGERKDKY